MDEHITLHIGNENNNISETTILSLRDVMHCKLITDYIMDTKQNVVPLLSSRVKSLNHLNYICQYARFMRTSDFPSQERTDSDGNAQTFILDGTPTEWEKAFVKSIPENELKDVLSLAEYLGFRFMLEGLCFTIGNNLATIFPSRPVEHQTLDWAILTPAEQWNTFLQLRENRRLTYENCLSLEGIFTKYVEEQNDNKNKKVEIENQFSDIVAMKLFLDPNPEPNPVKISGKDNLINVFSTMKPDDTFYLTTDLTLNNEKVRFISYTPHTQIIEFHQGNRKSLGFTPLHVIKFIIIPGLE